MRSRGEHCQARFQDVIATVRRFGVAAVPIGVVLIVSDGGPTGYIITIGGGIVWLVARLVGPRVLARR